MGRTLNNKRRVEEPAAVQNPAPVIPLLVDLRALILPSDLRLECMAANLSAGRLRSAFVRHSGLETVAGTIPLRDETLVVMANARAEERPVYILARDAERPLAVLLQSRLEQVTGILSFEGFAADRVAVLAAAGCATIHDYVGVSDPGSAGFTGARRAFAVSVSSSDSRAFARRDVEITALSAPKARGGALLKLLRPHQYAKNVLVFVPMLTSHQLNGAAFLSAFLAFVCFCLTASAVYVVNDFVDLHADRAHPSKRRRPFASGTAPLRQGLWLVPLLLGGAGLLALQLPALFGLLLLLYMATTTAYSFSLKKMMLVDVTVLSLLYSLRVVAGAAAVEVAVSEWLFAFSLMFFTALALIKRYVELSDRMDRDLPDPSNRDYRIADLPIIAALAAAAGMNAITVIALYVNSDTVKQLYGHPALLWLLCPLFLYWIGRVLLLAHRRQLDDDPIVFALTDVRSWLVGACTLTIVALAM